MKKKPSNTNQVRTMNGEYKSIHKPDKQWFADFLPIEVSKLSTTLKS